MLLHGETSLLSQRRRRQSEKIDSVSDSFMTDDQIRGSKSHGALAEYFSRKARRQTISFGRGESKQDDFGPISPDLWNGDALFRKVRNKPYTKQAHRSNERKGMPRKRSLDRNRALRRSQDNSAQAVVNDDHKRASHSSNPESDRQRRSRRTQNRYSEVEPKLRTEGCIYSGRDKNLSTRGTASECHISNNHNVQDEQKTEWESDGRHSISSMEKRVSGNDSKLLQNNAKQIRSIMNRIAFDSLPDMRMMRDKASRRNSTKTATDSQFKLKRKSKHSRGGINTVVPKDCRDKRQGVYTSSKVGPRTSSESVIESDESVVPLHISEKRPVKVASIFAYPPIMKLIKEAEKKKDPSKIEMPIQTAQINKAETYTRKLGRPRDESSLQNDYNFPYLDHKPKTSIDNKSINTLPVSNKNGIIKPKRGITSSWSWKSSKSEASQDEDTAKKREQEGFNKVQLLEWFCHCREMDKTAPKQRQSSLHHEQKRSTYDPSKDRNLMEEIAIEAKSEEKYKESYHEQNRAAIIQNAALLMESRNIVDGLTFQLPEQILQIIRFLAGNNRCCDCGSSAKLTFASVDHGQILCDTCAFHHIITGRDDYVKSLETDFDWKCEEVIKLMVGGNDVFCKKIYGTENGRRRPLSKQERQFVYESPRAMAHKISLSQIVKSVPKAFVVQAFN